MPAGLYEMAAGSSGVAVTASAIARLFALNEAFSSPPPPTAKAGRGLMDIRAIRIAKQSAFLNIVLNSLLELSRQQLKNDE